MRVAVDAMGGDYAPRELVAGAIAAARSEPAIIVTLVGKQSRIEEEIEKQGGAPENVTIVHAAQTIEMGDKPVDALRRKPDASILKALSMVRDGCAAGAVAAGSTGAAVAASLMTLKRLPGVRRPGIAVPLPAKNPVGVCLLIDAGANPACRPHHLHQYAVMGSNYYRGMFDAPAPRIALASIGEEESKGTHLTRDAARLLRANPSVNFVGNVEGRGLFGGACEVAVADGFVGNIILKAAEGLAEMLMSKASEVLAASDPAALRALARGIDYAEFGGAPLLGVDGLVLICHGRSDHRAIANAVRACTKAVNHRINDTIVQGLRRNQVGGRA